MFAGCLSVEPNNDTLVPFLTAFAKAAASMTRLREAALWSPLQFNPPNVEEYADFDHHQVHTSAVMIAGIAADRLAFHRGELVSTISVEACGISCVCH